MIPSVYARLLAAGWLALASAAAAEPISLGAASDFAVLGSSTVTNTGTTNISGDVGVSPGTAITGLSSSSVTGGTIHGPDGAANQAHSDALSAYTQLSLELPTTNLTGVTFGAGLTLTPGTYRFDSTALLNGALNLDFGNDPTGVFHFEIGSALTTASHSSILLLNGSSNNVFWQIGSSATLGTDTHFAGTILANASITLNTGTTLDGRALALNGAVTLDSNQIAVDRSVVLTTGGTLLLQANDQLNPSASVTLAGGTLGLNGHSAGAAGSSGAGTLTLTATSTLDFGAAGAGAGLIEFSALGGATNLNDHIVLQITNWQGTPGFGGGSERLLFGGAASEFTSRFGQNEVTFDGVAGYSAVQFGGYYEITSPLAFAEVPEPGTVFGGLAIVGLLGYRERRRAAAWWALARRAVRRA